MLSPVEQIKERLSIVEVISSYVKLQKAGKHYKGLSPFSNERTPSFYVSPEKDMFYCFSTNQGGDIFTFVEKMEGVDFSGALKILAERAGVTLAFENKEVRDKRTRLYDILEKAAGFYQQGLRRHPEVTEYLKSRGLAEATVSRFGIGYARNEWRDLHDHLSGGGFSTEDMLAAGLLKKAEGTGGVRHYDTFRGRVLFPIRDSAGRTVGFSGRILPEHDDGKTAKYLNSPETTLFNKSKILFGYDLAKGGIKKFNFSILVEGQMDTVMSHQAGYTNTVGVSGTALTRDQLALLGRLSRNLVMAFDADRAGIASAGKGAGLALSMGFDVKVARLPKGVDPADLIQKDPSLWKEAVKRSMHIVEFYLSELRDAGYDDRKFKLEAQKIVFPFIAKIQNRIDRAHFVNRVSRELNVSEDVIESELERIAEREDTAVHAEVPAASSGGTKEDAAEEQLARIILWQETLPAPQIDAAGLKTSLEAIIGAERLSELFARLEKGGKEHLLKTELLYQKDEEDGREERTLAQDVEELLHHLTYRTTRRELAETMEALRKAEVRGDSDATSQLLKKSQEIAERLRKFMGT